MNEKSTPTPEAHLVTVYTVNNSVTAELIRNTLQSRGVRCELGGEYQAGFTGALSVEVIVKETDAKKALDIIKELFPDS